VSTSVSFKFGWIFIHHILLFHCGVLWWGYCNIFFSSLIAFPKLKKYTSLGIICVSWPCTKVKLMEEYYFSWPCTKSTYYFICWVVITKWKGWLQLAAVLVNLPTIKPWCDQWCTLMKCKFGQQKLKPTNRMISRFQVQYSYNQWHNLLNFFVYKSCMQP